MRAKRKETEKESNIRQGVHLALSYGTSSTRCTKPSRISAVCVCVCVMSLCLTISVCMDVVAVVMATVAVVMPMRMSQWAMKVSDA